MNTFPNEENYNETPITRRSEFFNENLKGNYSDFSDDIVELIYDAYCVGMSETWVTRHLNDGDIIGIYKKIITFARCEIISACEKYDKAWEEQATNILHFYQNALLTLLTADVRTYCMNI